ncbi:site-2 protease family protein [Candidatus Collierbacteria bacterium]|nr:site-2 protease family protein [Candidatus Collierbacteria bacterium]
MIQLIVFFLILSVLVLVHEFGHFISARIFGIRVEEFGFGLPPRAKKLFTKWGTVFTLNWLPIGGFVKLYGEEYSHGDEIVAGEAGRFYDKPARVRAVVFVAGVIMNFLLGIFLFATVYSFVGIPVTTDRVRVEEIVADSPAEVAGLKIDDIVQKLSVSGKDPSTALGMTEIKETNQLVKLVTENAGREIELLVVAKDGSERTINVTPRKDPPAGQGALGIVLSNVELRKYPWWQMPFRGAVVGLSEAIAWGKDIASGLGHMVYGLVTGRGVPKDLSGPVGIYQVSGQVIKQGFLATLQFMGVLSINLAVLNILPLPALDGGHVFFLLIEKLIGKKRKNKIEGYVNTAGMIFLLSAMALITIRDVGRLIVK